MFAEYARDSVSRLVAKKMARDPFYGELDELTRIAISIGRMRLNPLQEVLQLWHTQNRRNFCLYLPLHYLQQEVPQDLLRQQMEKVNIEVVNKVGLDWRSIISHDRAHPMVQFVSGLGPKKAKKLLD